MREAIRFSAARVKGWYVGKNISIQKKTFFGYTCIETLRITKEEDINFSYA